MYSQAQIALAQPPVEEGKEEGTQGDGADAKVGGAKGGAKKGGKKGESPREGTSPREKKVAKLSKKQQAEVKHVSLST